jgi:hypothetical protein
VESFNRRAEVSFVAYRLLAEGAATRRGTLVAVAVPTPRTATNAATIPNNLFFICCSSNLRRFIRYTKRISVAVIV